ncbi:MAG: CDP-diacylglycerol--serine O-phosphatidyltransferase [Thermoplasmata archaeon]|nr:MAG: CDP-diacylglycerol--serine O-phosphatidyltransferase [Thermoplasmata archaeon]
MQTDVKKKARTNKRRKKSRDRRKGIYILPNLLTTGNLFAGFVSIVSTIDGQYEKAAIAILISWIFDILDGKVARLSQSASRFGIEYDSLADLVAFGVAPSILIYLWALKPLGRTGWLAAFVFMACGALRLARFNVQASTEAKHFFTGLPIPGAAGFIATITLFLYPKVPNPGVTFSWVLLCLTFIIGLLMVSNIKYSAFKELDFVKARPVPVILAFVLILVTVAAKPRLMLFAILTAYVLSGPSFHITNLFKYRQIGRDNSSASDQLNENEHIAEREAK